MGIQYFFLPLFEFLRKSLTPLHIFPPVQVPQLELSSGRGNMGPLLPTCYHAHSSYYASGSGGDDCCTRSWPWWCWITCKRAESGVLMLENVKMREGRSYK